MSYRFSLSPSMLLNWRYKSCHFSNTHMWPLTLAVAGQTVYAMARNFGMPMTEETSTLRGLHALCAVTECDQWWVTENIKAHDVGQNNSVVGQPFRPLRSQEFLVLHSDLPRIRHPESADWTCQSVMPMHNNLLSESMM